MKRMILVAMAIAVICGCYSWHVKTPSMALSPTLYIAPDGNDQGVGTRNEPLATLKGARDYIRQHRKEYEGPIVVEFAGGVYRFSEPVEFGKEDGGAAGKPVIYRAAPGAEVRFSGAVPIEGWHPVADKDVLARLPESSRDKVVVADLRAQGITDYGKLTPRGFGKSSQLAEAELLYDRVPMSLSRWPKKDWMGVTEVDSKKEYVKVDTDGRLARWVGEKDPWIFAYWHVDWAESYEPLAGVDVAGERLKRDTRYKPYGDKISPGRVRWYVLNLLSELELPGEYYLDRKDGKIYFVPPAEGKKAELTIASGLVKASDCSYLKFEGITFEGVRGRAMHLSGVTECSVIGCTIRAAAFNAISMSGTGNDVYGCDVFDTGAGGISVGGGNRKTLTAGNNNVENNHVHHYSRRARTYKTGITISGCGNRMAHNLVHHGPHMALSAPGNNHIVEYNEIHNAVHESGDAGAYYVGRDWAQRGNILRYNYWHHIKGSSSYGGMTIYLDDQHCGHTIIGNVFERCNQSVFIGGGDDNKVLNNVFIDSYKSAHLDNRGMGWQKKFTKDTNSSIHKQLHSVPYKSKIWAEAYPELVNVLDDDPGVPKRNVFARNISCGGSWDAINKTTIDLQTVEDNIVHDDDKTWATLKKDKLGRLLQLSFKDPDAVKAIGFEPIPVQKMGLYKDPRRASWPVVHPIDEVMLPHEKIKAEPEKVVAKLPPDPTLKVPRGYKAVSSPIELTVTHMGEIVKPPAKVRFGHDGTMLYVNMETPLPKKRSLGEGWAANDAIEIALQGADGPNADIFVFRGFTNSSKSIFKIVGNGNQQQAPALEQGTRYAARVTDNAWRCSWAIPLKEMGVSAGDRLRANVTVRRPGTGHFVMWRATHGDSTRCDKVGFLELAP